jgi:hypothetical protein
MHHILEILRLEFTICGLLLHFCCFGICLFACIGLNYYTTNNNTFNNIVISNLTKLYITCVCSSIQDHIFQIKTSFYFWKNLTLCAQFQFWWIQTLSKFGLYHKDNKSHHKCTKIIHVFEKTSCIATPPFNSKIPMLEHTNKSHNMIFKKNNSPFKNPRHYKLHFQVNF